MEAQRSGLAPGADGRPVPGAREPAVLAILLLALGLLLFEGSRLAGYELADVVEYMERAQSFARGEAQDPAGGVRSFGFSVLLSPFFWVHDRLGLEDMRPLVACVRGLQIVFGLGLVLACVRLGARLAGRGAGLAAGLVVACNPIFLQYGVSPVSGLASGLFVALGLDALVTASSKRRAFVGGVWLGAGVLMAYQSILIAAPILCFVVLHNRRRGWRDSATMFLGFGACVLVQVVLDRITWGEWGGSLVKYVIANAGSTPVNLLLALQLDGAAHWLYKHSLDLQGLEMDTAGGGVVRQLQPKLFYLLEIQRMLVLPVLLLFGLGVLRALRRADWANGRRWIAWMLLLTLALNLVFMSTKGAKSFRLWLPLLPILAPLCGLGFATLAGEARAAWAGPRRALGALALAASVVLGVRALLALDVREHGVYWTAMELVNDAAPRESGAPPVQVASAYHWAVFARAAPGVELVKLPHHLDRWAKLDEGRRAACLERLGELDWFLTHRPILEQGRDLFDFVNARFAVHEVLWDAGTHPTLGPLFVMRARDGSEGELVLTETLPYEDPFEYRRRLGLDRTLLAPMDFSGATGMSEARVTLLGFEYRTFELSGIGWITYHWTSAIGVPGDFTVVDRITPPDGKHAWQNNHGFAHGFRPSNEWVPGQILRESYPVLLGNDPFTGAFEPLGGPYRRGELVPLELWMTVVEFDADGNYLASLRPTESGASRPLDMSRPTFLPGERSRSAEGYVQSPDRLVRLASFLAPIRARDRWPDDGRGDPP